MVTLPPLARCTSAVHCACWSRWPPGFCIAKADPEAGERVITVVHVAADDSLDTAKLVPIASGVGSAPMNRRGADHGQRSPTVIQAVDGHRSSEIFFDKVLGYRGSAPGMVGPAYLPPWR